MRVLPFAVPGVVAALGAGILLFAGRELWYALRIYRGDPTAIADAVNDPGPVELQGVARAENGTVRSPFSDSECVICEWEVEREYASSGMGGTHWETEVDGLMGGPFALDDGTARCRVEPAGSDRQLQPQRVSVPAGTELPDRLVSFAADHPEVETRPTGTGAPRAAHDYRFVERRLDAGETCFVYGYGHYDSGVGRGAGWVNLVVNGDGARRFLIADTRARGVAWELVKMGLGGVVVALVVLFGAAVAYAILA